MKRRLSKRTVPVAVAAGLLLLVVVGWFGVVGPQRSKAASLATQIQQVRDEIRQNRLLARPRSTEAAVKVADVFRLSKAMPGELDMPGILLELNRVAGEAGITFDSITPGEEVAAGSYRMVPVDVVFTGNYYELSDLLYRLRNLVEVHDGKLATTGRLFTVGSVGFGEAEAKFPKLQAKMTVNAYVYGGVPVSTDTTGGTSTGETGAATTTTTTTTSTSTTSSGPTASGSGVTQ